MRKLLILLLALCAILTGCAVQTPADTLTYEGGTYVYLQFPGDLFCYDLREAVDCEEDERVPVPHEAWDFVYHEGDLFVAESQRKAAAAYYAADENYTWSVVVEDRDCEEIARIHLTVDTQARKAIYAMEGKARETTLLFEDIEQFGTLVKTSNDGFVEARAGLACHAGTWYWRTETIDDTVEGWPEYVVRLPESITKQIRA